MHIEPCVWQGLYTTFTGRNRSANVKDSIALPSISPDYRKHENPSLTHYLKTMDRFPARVLRKLYLFVSTVSLQHILCARAICRMNMRQLHVAATIVSNAFGIEDSSFRKNALSIQMFCFYYLDELLKRESQGNLESLLAKDSLHTLKIQNNILYENAQVLLMSNGKKLRSYHVERLNFRNASIVAFFKHEIGTRQRTFTYDCENHAWNAKVKNNTHQSVQRETKFYQLALKSIYFPGSEYVEPSKRNFFISDKNARKKWFYYTQF